MGAASTRSYRKRGGLAGTVDVRAKRLSASRNRTVRPTDPNGLFWPRVILGSSVAAGLVDAALVLLPHGKVLLESVPQGERVAVYNATSAAAGPLLGFAIAAVAILIALPERPSVDRLRELAAWRALPKMLLVTAGLLTLTLVLTIIAQAADASTDGHPLFEVFAFALMCGSLVGLVLSSGAFALAVTQVQDEDVAAGP
jgi:hypothetical protein